MKIVLLSGGSGKRLWPLSNDMRSKQFLPLLQNPQGEDESMVQRVWRQLKNVGLSTNSFIATGRAQVELLQSQLNNEATIIVEPERRDTFPAIALAAAYLYSVEGVSLNEVVTIMPVDPFVSDDFFSHVVELEHAIKESDAELALMGVVPDSPSESFGYIVPVHNTGVSKVEQFKEKPRKEEAAALINRGALWNCGVFAFRLDTLINLLISMNLPIQYDEMCKQYRNLPKNSFDYEVVEKLQNIVVTRYVGQWRDLGTWHTLTSEMDASVYGKGVVTEDSINTHLVNELEIPITVIGLSNVVVAASPDGILVSDKSHSPRIKELSGDWNQRPMYEERRWGQYKVVDFIRYDDGREVLTKRITITAGRNLSYQYHMMRSEVWTVIGGEGEMVLDGQYRRIAAGDVIQVPAGMKHTIRAINDLEIIEVQSGSELIEEDIVRLCMDWTEIMSYTH
ncbi:mannose-1-phosphate guanylyltransferase [Paenibacillus cellulosilyticus]|uniref:Mannose-1-phosphate guanylyltransferase n=1 Tax=Paenibacillus cellulosilyticus TaxID=375489 RepID=A0A2V2YKQ6_9BACL|nr:sugar phosphate nucleotidyltransferase [Paenibacillus cellulosilyticus]PWV93807.1 mannose-1-phosphate guanylyltransferase [Paenibacillus cellulosilyticus]QKS47422.1 cupin domain-containing protein [Paenibacillus cellulosilyticus]